MIATRGVATIIVEKWRRDLFPETRFEDNLFILYVEYQTVRDSMEDDLRTGTQYHIAFLVCINTLWCWQVKSNLVNQSIKDSGIPPWACQNKFYRRSHILFPSLPSFFPTLSLAIVFACAPLSERLEQANFSLERNSHQRPLLGKNYFPIQNLSHLYDPKHLNFPKWRSCSIFIRHHWCLGLGGITGRCQVFSTF